MACSKQTSKRVQNSNSKKQAVCLGSQGGEGGRKGGKGVSSDGDEYASVKQIPRHKHPQRNNSQHPEHHLIVVRRLERPLIAVAPEHTGWAQHIHEVVLLHSVKATWRACAGVAEVPLHVLSYHRTDRYTCVCVCVCVCLSVCLPLSHTHTHTHTHTQTHTQTQQQR